MNSTKESFYLSNKKLLKHIEKKPKKRLKKVLSKYFKVRLNYALLRIINGLRS